MLKYTDFDIVFSEIPDEVTLAISISNCPNNCKGCHSPELMKDIGKPLTENTLSKIIRLYERNITCICFMGGDREPIEVERLSLFVQKTYPKIKSGWYSGKTELPETIDINSFQYVKLGPYIEKLGSLRSKNTNQKLFKIVAPHQIVLCMFLQ